MVANTHDDVQIAKNQCFPFDVLAIFVLYFLWAASCIVTKSYSTLGALVAAVYLYLRLTANGGITANRRRAERSGSRRIPAWIADLH